MSDFRKIAGEFLAGMSGNLTRWSEIEVEASDFRRRVSDFSSRMSDFRKKAGEIIVGMSGIWKRVSEFPRRMSETLAQCHSIADFMAYISEMQWYKSDQF
ncbi:hypothetical protein CAI16_11930 [Virgibacillus dokdonensis]|uniref:Uncharacterized protein n=1 Tax=Virgibacillus dokdonensis TaxID=302167 RepID=A0A3E0WMT7_9BACI|nr:hypothetical protein CAI16_11930 [Virgibacillus dokdonensis]